MSGLDVTGQGRRHVFSSQKEVTRGVMVSSVTVSLRHELFSHVMCRTELQSSRWQVCGRLHERVQHDHQYTVAPYVRWILVRLAAGDPVDVAMLLPIATPVQHSHRFACHQKLCRKIRAPAESKPESSSVVVVDSAWLYL